MNFMKRADLQKDCMLITLPAHREGEGYIDHRFAAVFTERMPRPFVEHDQVKGHWKVAAVYSAALRSNKSSAHRNQLHTQNLLATFPASHFVRRTPFPVKVCLHRVRPTEDCDICGVKSKHSIDGAAMLVTAVKAQHTTQNSVTSVAISTQLSFALGCFTFVIDVIVTIFEVLLPYSSDINKRIKFNAKFDPYYSSLDNSSSFIILNHMGPSTRNRYCLLKLFIFLRFKRGIYFGIKADILICPSSNKDLFEYSDTNAALEFEGRGGKNLAMELANTLANAYKSSLIFDLKDFRSAMLETMC
uniref:Uncharacterized protein n=1 Tax=Glossina brevipalpis TaxID=37001 RepID=A0A1A9WQC9_9MUSC